MSESAVHPPPLDIEGFTSALVAFRDRFNISLRSFRSMLREAGENLSVTSAFRLFKGELPAGVFARLQPSISSAVMNYLQAQGWSLEQIEAEFSSHFLPDKELINMIAARCPLLPEAVKFFGLSFDPFDVDRLPDADDLYRCPALDSVTARVRDAVRYQRFLAVVGGVGTGKSLLKLRVADELTAEGKSLLIYPEFFDMQEVTVASIASQILAALGQTIPQEKTRRVNRIKEVLTQMQQEGISVAIVIDEAHRLHDKVISSFKNFWELTNGRNSRLLGVLLFGQPSFVESRLRDARFKEIRQRIQVIEMPLLDVSEYISHRIALAGGNIDKLFEKEAVARIAANEVSPLASGNLANAALMDAFDQEEKKVTVSLPFFKKLAIGQPVRSIRRPAA